MICSTCLHRLTEVNQRFLHRLISGSSIVLVGFSTGIAAVQLHTGAKENLPKHIHINAELHSPAPFYGLPDLKVKDGKPGSMIYLADAGIEGLIIQILVHGLVANEVKKKKQLQAQQEADRVLAAYDQPIGRNTHHRLVKFALRNYPRDDLTFSVIGNDTPDEDFIVAETSPSFFMSQDEKTIVLRHRLKASLSSAPDEVIFENSARTSSSRPYQGTDGWFGDSDAAFRATTQRLYSVTFKALIRELYGRLNNQASNEKTYKYYIGDERFYERASQIEETCRSRMIRNLRGHILILEKQQDECIH